MSDSASGPRPSGGDGPLSGSDLELLAGLARANEWTRSLLCTLGRRGTWLRHREPDRADALLRAVSAWPWYKAGQFLFDLLEWEDFMVDGPPSPEFPGDVDEVALKRLVGLLRLAAFQIDATLPAWAPDDNRTHAAAQRVPADLPPLEPGYYLYQDVVLGVLLSVSTNGTSDPGTAGRA
jgi:hypothetical protein